jgi:hypothetical protein
MNKELKAYYKAIEDLTKLFCKKYFNEDYKYDKEDWVGRDIGGLICINDYCFNMSNIEEAIKYNATEEEVFGYYDYCLEKALSKKDKEPPVNFRNYIKYYKGFSWKKTKEK